MSKPFFAVIMAGGTGTRLWPASRKSHPKQFHAFTGEKTLLQETFDRLIGILPIDHIFVSTGTSHVDLVKQNIPDLPTDHIILEPESRNTGPAIGLATLTIEAKHPEAIIATIASDHTIKNPEEFQATLLAAFESIVHYPKSLVTVGINPTRPDTGFGYIKIGKELATINEKRIFTIESFKEKPDHATAEIYLRSFEYLWNAGYFIFKASSLHHWLAQHASATLSGLEQIIDQQQKQTLDEKTFQSLYGAVESVAIEPLIVERLTSEERLVIPSPLEWSDVGNWQTLYDFLSESSGETSVVYGKHLDKGSKNLLVYGDERLIATLGLENIVIVDTPDALLIARRDQVGSDIKHLIETLKKESSDLL